MPSPGMRAQRLGVFGGTFDPPHVGHLVTAVNIRHALRLDRVLLVVANVPWQKAERRRISAPEDRLAMVEAAVAEVEGLAASSEEIRRGGPSYSADTLAALHREDPSRELFLVLGSDAAAGLASWDHADRLQELASIVVVDRPGDRSAALPAGFRGVRVEVPRLEVSSTDLRDRVRTGRPLDYLLTPSVISCITQRELYRWPE